MLSDTHPEAERVQLELLRRLSSAERIAKMRSHTQWLVGLSRRALAEANPGLDQRELDLLWVEHQYGKELAGRLRNYLENRASCPQATL